LIGKFQIFLASSIALLMPKSASDLSALISGHQDGSDGFAIGLPSTVPLVLVQAQRVEPKLRATVPRKFLREEAGPRLLNL
jgi:hypothetical protein